MQNKTVKGHLLTVAVLPKDDGKLRRRSASIEDHRGLVGSGGGRYREERLAGLGEQQRHYFQTSN